MAETQNHIQSAADLDRSADLLEAYQCGRHVDRQGMSKASTQILDHLVGAGGRVIVFDKGRSNSGPM